MTIKQIFKILNSFQWKEEESQASLHILDHWKTCYLQGKNAYHKALYSCCVYSFADNYVFEWAPAEEARRTLDWTLEKHKKDKIYFKKKYKEFKEIMTEVKKVFLKVQNGIGDLSNEQIKNLFIEVSELGKDQYGYALLSEGVDTLTDGDYAFYLPRVGRENIPEMIRALSTFGKLGFLEREKLNLMRITVERIFKNDHTGSRERQRKLKEVVKKGLIAEIKKSPEFIAQLKKHAQNYFWIQNNFYGAVYLDNEYFLNQILELIKRKSLKEIKKEIENLENKEKIVKKRRNEIYKKYNLPLNSKLFFEMIRYFAILQDDRKEIIQKLVFCIDGILNETAKRFKIDRKILNNYFVSEIIDLFGNGKKLKTEDLKKRAKVVYFSYIKNGKTKTDIFFGEKAGNITNFFKKKRVEIAASGILKGFVASLGKGEKIVKGKVRIVFDPHKDIFKEGEILVTGMTRPEFVPLMKKAKAIVTNEGGITTHAAIISRELKIPCIIGAKIATDVLKTGDFIELDLEKGIIKKIKSQISKVEN